MIKEHEHGNTEILVQLNENKLMKPYIIVVTRPEPGPGVGLDLNGAMALFPFSDDDTD